MQFKMMNYNQLLIFFGYYSEMCLSTATFTLPLLVTHCLFKVGIAACIRKFLCSFIVLREHVLFVVLFMLTALSVTS